MDGQEDVRQKAVLDKGGQSLQLLLMGRGSVLLDFWCELKLQSMKKRKVSVYTDVAVFEQCTHAFNLQWMGKGFFNAYYTFLNAEGALCFLLTLNCTAPSGRWGAPCPMPAMLLPRWVLTAARQWDSTDGMLPAEPARAEAPRNSY